MIEEDSFKEHEYIIKIENNIINNLNLIKEIFEIPKETTKLKIRIDGFAPRKSDKIVVWPLCETFNVDLTIGDLK
jgi:hypothetical protein